MIYAARPSQFRNNIAPYREANVIGAAPRPGLAARLIKAVFVSRQRQAERDIDAYLARTGHRLTDSVEREIYDHFLGGSWYVRR
jgi:hypothetical protein